MASPEPPHVHNRIWAVMQHTTRYAFEGQARLAQDTGVSKSAICRLLSGKSVPSLSVLTRIARALEDALERPLELRELVSLDGSYPTRFVCQLCGCAGCLPEEAYDEEGELLPAFEGVRPGEWISSAPRGEEGPC